ncbi:Glycosyl transferase family 2, partial [Haemophilus influenzae]
NIRSDKSAKYRILWRSPLGKGIKNTIFNQKV